MSMKYVKYYYLQDPYASLGQRRGLSVKDIAKLNEMYEEDCQTNSYFESFDIYLNEVIDYFQQNINNLFGRNTQNLKIKN